MKLTFACFGVLSAICISTVYNNTVKAQVIADHTLGTVVDGSSSYTIGEDIRLKLQDYLLIRHDSLISATAKGQGNGGNLSINSPVILGLENSDIIANAFQ